MRVSFKVLFANEVLSARKIIVFRWFSECDISAHLLRELYVSLLSTFDLTLKSNSSDRTVNTVHADEDISLNHCCFALASKP